MIDKLLAELSKATVWMPTQVLVDKVGARNTTNVSLRLKDLEKNGSAVSRSRMEFGIKVIEWRHADKPEVGDFVPGGRGTKAAPVVKKSLTTEKPTVRENRTVEMPTDKACCNAAAVVATTASSHVSELRKEIADLKAYGATRADEMMAATARIAELKETVDGQRKTIDAKDSEIKMGDAAIDGWLRLAKEFECKSIPELRVFIDSALIRIEALKKAKVAAPKNPAQPRRPFSVTGLTGYHTGNDRVTLFLNRRLSAKSVTFPADKLAQLADMARAA